MAYSNIITHLVVVFDEQKSLVSEYHFVGGSTKPRSPAVDTPMCRQKLKSVIDSYWRFVDQSIKDHVFDEEASNQAQSFLGELEARGQEIANLLFPRHIQTEIWKAADEADVLMINTNLEEVPWEALFCASAGMNRGFLSRNCVIQRQIEGSSIEDSPEKDKGDGIVLCIDPQLIFEEEERGEIALLSELQDLNVELYQTSSSRELSRRVQDARVIHWLCEHVVDSGLRLADNTFYTYRDIETHKFPRNSVLFMLSCASARIAEKSSAYSARVSAASGCTVVAPSSMVAVSEAVHFIQDIQCVLQEHPGAKLSEVWTLIKNPIGGRRNEDSFTWRDCYLLWFGIYGDCEETLG